jgi:CheY-like chemotaxis protein
MDYILLVEDDENIQQFLTMVLSKEGYQVIIAPNGEAALEISAGHEPALILLDMHMPTMDGARFLEAYRSTREGATPIVVVTVDHLCISNQMMAGIEAVLLKPFSINDLLNTVKRYVTCP